MFESRYLQSCWKKKREAVQMHTSNSFSSATLVIYINTDLVASWKEIYNFVPFFFYVIDEEHLNN